MSNCAEVLGRTAWPRLDQRQMKGRGEASPLPSICEAGEKAMGPNLHCQWAKVGRGGCVGVGLGVTVRPLSSCRKVPNVSLARTGAGRGVSARQVGILSVSLAVQGQAHHLTSPCLVCTRALSLSPTSCCEGSGSGWEGGHTDRNQDGVSP